MRKIILVLLVALPFLSIAQDKSNQKKATLMASEIEEKIIEWRRYFHQNPELSNREFKTADKIAQILKGLGIEVQTKVAHTGVVGILKGGKPGPVVALRADIDALPVTERGDIPFISKVKANYNGIETGVMHACGHDGHMAVLLGAAEVLSGMKKELKGTVKFIFQPAEEGPPLGEEGGAKLMIKEGVLKNPDVDVIFGLHISAGLPAGQISYRSAGIMASSDRFVIKVKGKQTHGSTPWGGVDPVVTSSQIINSLQTVVSRQTPLTDNIAVVSVGMVKAGLRYNIIPEEVEIVGTIRTLDTKVQDNVHASITRIATKTAESMGATADVAIEKRAPVTYNDPSLTAKMVPTFERVVGKENAVITNPTTAAEDFSFYQQQVPGLFFFLGAMYSDKDLNTGLGTHHSPDFKINEEGLLVGVKTMVNLTLDYMDNPMTKK
ncbi:MAG: amidohydrolase [Cyclobacteriaceae bacterium]|nr:amidohydrolase [Cyclobacteriaceae bacterium]